MQKSSCVNRTYIKQWDRQGTSYPPQADTVYDNETVSRVKEAVGWGYPQRTICIQISLLKWLEIKRPLCKVLLAKGIPLRQRVSDAS